MVQQARNHGSLSGLFTTILREPATSGKQSAGSFGWGSLSFDLLLLAVVRRGFLGETFLMELVQLLP